MVLPPDIAPVAAHPLTNSPAAHGSFCLLFIKDKPSLAGRLNGLFERIAVEEAAIGPSTTTLAAEVDAIISDYPAALIAYLKGKRLR